MNVQAAVSGRNIDFPVYLRPMSLTRKSKVDNIRGCPHRKGYFHVDRPASTSLSPVRKRLSYHNGQDDCGPRGGLKPELYVYQK